LKTHYQVLVAPFREPRLVIPSSSALFAAAMTGKLRSDTICKCPALVSLDLVRGTTRRSLARGFSSYVSISD